VATGLSVAAGGAPNPYLLPLPMPARLAGLTWVSSLTEVYGYIVERQIPACDHCGCEARWEREESVWGHIGTDYAEQSAKEALQSYL
jgi:hypothetical protein